MSVKKQMPHLALALALLICLTACASPGGEGTEGYSLYFLSEEDGGPALTAAPYQGEGEPTPRQLMNALLNGPDTGELATPFPAGVFLRSCQLEEGILYVDLSENYGGLTDVSLTLADYAIVLTLCQLDGVEGVCITAAGQPLSYRSHQILTPEEVLTTGASEPDPSEEIRMENYEEY